MAVKFLDLKKQYLGIRAEIDEAIRRVVERGCFVGGEEVEAFENEFSEYLNKNAFCVKTESGNFANLSLRGSEATEAIHNADLQVNSVDLLVRANRYGDARHEFSYENSRNDNIESANCKDNQQYSITSDRDPLRSSGTSGG
ncbi:MAG: DegT/DnrJ/EryC1/StrS family aminotransferase, partial [Helicobacteraceae bacterium]|nr:DegT/DnrJ/EryC1/StrS family aminotransferase [Helicobacteraceae bacterium]